MESTNSTETLQKIATTKSLSDGELQADKKQQILNAVFRCCAHYGYRRTNMEDIAREAGISRTALYYYFRNKEEVFLGLSDWFHDQVMTATNIALSYQGPADLAILKILEARMALFFELVFLSEHGKEIADSNNLMVGPACKQHKQLYLSLLANKLKTAQSTGDINYAAVGMNDEDAALFLIDCANGLMPASGAGSDLQQNLVQYRKRLAQLVHLTVIAWNGKPSFKPKKLS